MKSKGSLYLFSLMCAALLMCGCATHRPAFPQGRIDVEPQPTATPLPEVYELYPNHTWGPPRLHVNGKDDDSCAISAMIDGSPYYDAKGKLHAAVDMRGGGVIHLPPGVMLVSGKPLCAYVFYGGGIRIGE